METNKKTSSGTETRTNTETTENSEIAADTETRMNTETSTNAETTANSEITADRESTSDGKTTGRLLAGLILRIAVLMLAGKIAGVWFLGAGIQRGNSMYPGLRDGELGFTWKRSGYYPGDIVWYHPEGRQGAYYRIAAVSGDEVMISEEGFTVNGAFPAESVVYPTDKAGDYLAFPITVPEGEVFLLNDFRSDLSDSRSFGTVRVDQLEGVLILSVKRRSF